MIIFLFLFFTPVTCRKLKKRGESPEDKEKVVIPVAKKPITKSYVVQTCLSFLLCACAALSFVAPETVASNVFGLRDIAFMLKSTMQLNGGLLTYMATLFFVLRELSYSYASAKAGYMGVVVGSLMSLKGVLSSIQNSALNAWSVGFVGVLLLSLGTALVQLKKIQTYTAMKAR